MMHLKNEEIFLKQDVYSCLKNLHLYYMTYIKDINFMTSLKKLTCCNYVNPNISDLKLEKLYINYNPYYEILI